MKNKINDINLKVNWMIAFVLAFLITFIAFVTIVSAQFNPGILIAVQSGWTPPKYQITQDSIIVDRFFEKYTSDSNEAWTRLQRDSMYIQDAGEQKVYAEIGSFTMYGPKKFYFKGLGKHRYYKKFFTNRRIIN